MAVYKDSTGTWRWRKSVKNPFSGVRKRLGGTPGVNLKGAAEEMERAVIEKFIRDPAKEIPIDGLLVKDVATRFLAYMESLTDKSPTYLLKIESTIRNHIIPDLGDRRIDQVTDQDLRVWKLTLHKKPLGVRGNALKARARAARTGTVLEDQTGRPVRHIKSRTVKDILRVCHGMFTFAIDEKLVTAIPRFPKPPEIEKQDPEFLEFGETIALYEAARDDWERLLLKFAVQTGLREGEQMAIQWKHVKFETNQIAVKRAYKKNYKGQLPLWIDGPTKGKRHRLVDVSAALIEELRKAKQLQAGEALIFARPDGTHMTPDQFNAILRRAAKKANLQRHVHWHSLRHTFGTQVAAQDVDLQTLQAWLGHQSIRTTEIYAKWMPSRGAKQVEKLTRWA